METWTAGQIGASFGAYSGRTVEFTTDDGTDVRGVLDQSDGGAGSIHSFLTVDGNLYTLTKMTPVVVL
jgi:hypothetical protein